jgi:phage terminase large subunit GpA-like protein
MSREQHSDAGSTPEVYPTREITTSLDQLSLASTSDACQHCGCSFTEGDDVVAYVSKPAEKRTHEVGHCVCAHNEHRQQEVFTLGVHELLVAGRIGIASDAATQSTWPILVDPVPLGVSAPATTTIRWLPPETPLAEQVTPTATHRQRRRDARAQVTVGSPPTTEGDD